jgi:hypothetical protein
VYFCASRLSTALQHHILSIQQWDKLRRGLCLQYLSP